MKKSLRVGLHQHSIPLLLHNEPLRNSMMKKHKEGIEIAVHVQQADRLL